MIGSSLKASVIALYARSLLAGVTEIPHSRPKSASDGKRKKATINQYAPSAEEIAARRRVVRDKMRAQKRIERDLLARMEGTPISRAAKHREVVAAWKRAGVLS